MSIANQPELKEGELLLAYFEDGLLYEERLPVADQDRRSLVALIKTVFEQGSVPLSDRLSAGEVDALTGYPVASSDEISAAIIESAKAWDSLVRGSLTTKEAGVRLGVNASRIRQRLDEGSLWGFKPFGSWMIPAWQFVEGGLTPGLDQVNRHLAPELDPLSVESFFLTPSVDLEIRGRKVSPLDWLRAGLDPKPVAVIAASL